MNKEQYVSFDTAKLLRKKEFDWPCMFIYTNEGTIWKMLDYVRQNEPDDEDDECLCPTQQMACRWLREEKGIFVDIRVYSGLPVQFGYDINVLYPDKTLVDKGGTFGFSSYEEATEKGLKYVLQNLSKYL